MTRYTDTLIALTAALCVTGAVTAQAQDELLLLAQLTADAATDEDEALKLAALEGLLAASPERALPLVRKVLAGDHSQEVKSRALFVLGQSGSDEADEILLGYAANPADPLHHEAIRMIGIGGKRASLEGLADIYKNGDSNTRSSVLNAYLVAGMPDAVYQIARIAEGEDYDAAVAILGAMGGAEQLRRLADEGNRSEGLAHALGIAGDLDALRRMASESNDPAEQQAAIRAMGIAGGPDAGAALEEAYRNAADAEIREAALQGMLMAGADQTVLRLFRESRDAGEKRQLLRQLMIMNSDLALDIIDSTLGDN